MEHLDVALTVGTGGIWQGLVPDHDAGIVHGQAGPPEGEGGAQEPGQTTTVIPGRRCSARSRPKSSSARGSPTTNTVSVPAVAAPMSVPA